MIFWIIIWIILGIPTIFISITDVVNYTYNHPPQWHSTFICICIFIIILSCAMVFSERASYKEFINEYYEKEYLIERIYFKASNIQKAEEQIYGRITQTNIKLFYFQHRNKKFGIFSPYPYSLSKLPPLQLKYYDVVVNPYL